MLDHRYLIKMLKTLKFFIFSFGGNGNTICKQGEARDRKARRKWHATQDGCAGHVTRKDGGSRKNGGGRRNHVTVGML